MARRKAALNTALTGGGTVTFNCGGKKTITLTGAKTISNDTTIQGGDLITISGGDAVGVFSVLSGVTLTLQDLTVANGEAYDVAGLNNYGGTVNILHSIFTGNTKDCTGAGSCDAYGGAISNYGVLNITDSTFS